MPAAISASAANLIPSVSFTPNAEIWKSSEQIAGGLPLLHRYVTRRSAPRPMQPEVNEKLARLSATSLDDANEDYNDGDNQQDMDKTTHPV